MNKKSQIKTVWIFRRKGGKQETPKTPTCWIIDFHDIGLIWKQGITSRATPVSRDSRAIHCLMITALGWRDLGRRESKSYGGDRLANVCGPRSVELRKDQNEAQLSSTRITESPLKNLDGRVSIVLSHMR